MHRHLRLSTGTLHHFTFVCNLKRGTYKVRVGATDLAGNHQSKVATGTLTVSWARMQDGAGGKPPAPSVGETVAL